MGLIEKLQAKLEIYRLEQRYTRRTKRTTFVSGAAYVNGEYVYPNSHDSSEAISPISLSKNSTGSAEREFWSAPTTTTVTADSNSYSSNSPTSPGFGGNQSQQAMFGSQQMSGSGSNNDLWTRR